MEIDIVKLLEHVKQLYADKEKLAIALELSKLPKERRYRSESINELAQSLSKTQGEMCSSLRRNTNVTYGTKYSSITDIVDASRPELSKNNLAVVQDIVQDDNGACYLYTMLLHTSDQWIESRIKITPPKSDIDTFADYVTQMRRRAYESLVGVVTGDEDDDGQELIKEQRKMYDRGTALPTQQKPRESLETLTTTEIEQLEDELETYPELIEDIFIKYDVRTIADLPRSEFKLIITRVRQRVAQRNGK